MHRLLVLAGPSAVGKSFTARALVETFPANFAYAPVHTTRLKRSVETRAKERIFVSDQAFRQLIQEDVFFAYEKFAEYFYGYSKEYLDPDDKHLIIDVSPYLLPAFLQHKSVLAIGLQAPDGFEKLSEERMISRGDSLEIRKARRPFIRRDIADLQKLQPLIDQHGKFFRIEDNRTIPEQALPWIIAQLEL